MFQNFQYSERDIVRHAVPINEVFRTCYPGLWRDTHQDYSVRCPFHADTKPSFRLWQMRNKGRCYGSCNKLFDPIEIWAARWQISEAEATRQLSQLYHIDTVALRRMQILSAYTASVVNNPSALYSLGTPERALLYLMDRKIDEHIARSSRCLASGSRLLIPHFMGDMLMAVTSRRLDDEDKNEPKYLTIQGPMGDYPFTVGRNINPMYVFVCESAIDAMSLLSVGLPALAIHLSSVTDRRVLQHLNSYMILYVMFDGDKPGRDAAKKLASASSSVCVSVDIPDGEDANSLLMNGVLLDTVKMWASGAQDGYQTPEDSFCRARSRQPLFSDLYRFAV